MISEKIEMQPVASETEAVSSVGLAGLSVVSAAALVVWCCVTTIVDPLLIAEHVVFVFCVVSLVLFAIGFAFHVASADSSLLNQLTHLLHHDTWRERAVLACVMTFVTVAFAVTGFWIGGEAGRLLESAFLPSACIGGFALIAFSKFLASETRPRNKDYWALTMSSMSWMLGLGGLVFLTVAGLFFVLPIWLVAAVSFCFVVGGATSWWALRDKSSAIGHHDPNGNFSRDRKLGFYQAGFVPLFCLGAVLTIATPQLTPLYVLVGLVTFVFGINKLTQLAIS